MATQKELQAYLAQKVYENAAELAPELVEYITGDSFEAIDQSIAKVKASTAALVASIGAFDVREGTTAPSDAQLAAQIQAMSVDEFANYRMTVGLGRR